VFSRFSKKIESKNIDHGRFLIITALLIILSIVILYFTLFSWQLVGIVTPQDMQIFMIDISIWLSIGILSGIMVSSLILLSYYLNKVWDLHIVVPNYLMIFLSTIALHFLVGIIFNEIFFALQFPSYMLGYSLGGMLPGIAYINEVKKEHSKN
jgi:hypothetical protein